MPLVQQATGEDYAGLLKKLSPRGPAWGGRGFFYPLLQALGQELARVHNRALMLVDEADPRTTQQLLPAWENDAALPDPCITDPVTFQQRRLSLSARLTLQGGQSNTFFVALALSLGYTITISYNVPFRAGFSRAGDPLTNGLWRFVWNVHSTAANTVRSFLAGQDTAGEPLKSWGNTLLECTFNRYKPAHTRIQFSYGP